MENFTFQIIFIWWAADVFPPKSRERQKSKRERQKIKCERLSVSCLERERKKGRKKERERERERVKVRKKKRGRGKRKGLVYETKMASKKGGEKYGRKNSPWWEKESLHSFFLYFYFLFGSLKLQFPLKLVFCSGVNQYSNAELSTCGIFL